MSQVATASPTNILTQPVSYPTHWRPVYWHAITAGAVVALGVQLILTLLGIGLGLAMSNSANENGDSTVGVPAIVWLIVSGMISFSAGGFVTGWIAGVLDTRTAAALGATSWALAAVFGATVTVVSGSSLASGVGTALSGSQMSTRTTDFGRDLPRNSTGQAGRLSTLDTATDTLAQSDRRTTSADASQLSLDARQAARTAAQAALWTSFAFLLSMLASAVASTFGRRAWLRPPVRDQPFFSVTPLQTTV